MQAFLYKTLYICCGNNKIIHIMKSFHKLLAVLFLQACCFNAFSQVSLDHTFTPTTAYYVIGFENVVEPIGYYCFIATEHQINMYKADYTLYKAIDVNLLRGYTLSSVATAGKHLINTDDKVELFVSANSSQTSNTNSTALIINEDGQIIHSFGYNYMLNSMGFFNVNGQIKMLVMEYQFTTHQTLSYLYSVYSCYGNFTPSGITSMSSTLDAVQPFPNPAVNTINLTYKLEPGKTSVIRVYNMNGQLMDSFNIGSDFEAIIVDLSHYAKGIYIYEYDGISNKFVVQ